MSRIAFFAHANVFLYSRQPMPIEIALARIPEEYDRDPEAYVLTVDHSHRPMNAKDRYTHRYMHQHLHLPLDIPRSVPYEWVSFSVRGLYNYLDQEEGGVVLVKGSEQKHLFASFGLPVVSVDHLPRYRDLWGTDVPSYVHDDVHVEGNTSECCMAKVYRFARYMQQVERLNKEVQHNLLRMEY